MLKLLRKYRKYLSEEKDLERYLLMKAKIYYQRIQDYQSLLREVCYVILLHYYYYVYILIILLFYLYYNLNKNANLLFFY